MEYLVSWYIDIEADSPEEAVLIAFEIQRDPCSEATVFQVDGVNYDAQHLNNHEDN